MLTDQQLDDVDVGRTEAHPDGHTSGHRRPGERVVLDPRDLADVVQQAREQQQVGSGHLAQEPVCLHARLHQVPVHGPTVDGVALGPVADRRPLGQPTGHQTGQVEGLPDADEVLMAGQQLDEAVPGRGGPGSRQPGHGGCEVGHGDGAQRQPAAYRGGGSA